METDSPWKEAIEAYFRDFMAFFFPNIHDGIDWNEEYQFMDKELERIVRDAETGRRIVDKLVRVCLKNGGETWFLIHIEVQGYADKTFEYRMFVYNYRLSDKYGVDVVSIGIMVDADPNYKPGDYTKSLFGCEVRFRFPVVKVLEYGKKWSDLERNTNPFSMVVMAHLKAQELGKGKEAERKQWKLNLVRMLYDRGYERKDILELFRFIDWLMVLPEDMGKDFWDELKNIEKDKKMPYVTSVERIGIEKGMQKGIQQGEMLVIKRLLSHRFGQIPEWADKRLALASSDELKLLTDRIMDAASIDEIFFSIGP